MLNPAFIALHDLLKHGCLTFFDRCQCLAQTVLLSLGDDWTMCKVMGLIKTLITVCLIRLRKAFVVITS